MFLYAVLTAVALGAQDNLAANGAFDDGLRSWTPSASSAVTLESVAVDGRTAARIAVPVDARPDYPCLVQEWKVEPGQLFELRGNVRAIDVRDGYGAYLVIEFHRSGQGRLTYSQSRGITGSSDWSELTVRGAAPPDADLGRVLLVVNGRGEGQFDNIRLTSAGSVDTPPLSGPVTITVTDEVVCKEFLGFGFEDDGWFYNPTNAANGVTPDDYPIREGRIEWMDPDHVRMFFWIKDYCPSGDWETFTFDSPNMQSRYRTLDTYQRLGTEVNVTGVEWGFDDPYGDLEKTAKGIGALMEHLVRDRGYTCIKYWTLTNEPNGGWRHAGKTGLDAFEAYAELHRLVKREFERRALEIRIVGSDDTSGFEWFTRCVQDPAYFKTADLFSSHRYAQYPDRVLAPFFFDERLDLLAAQEQRKPFVVEEFGFQDSRSGTVENPLMMTYPYAVWTADFCIEGLNRGVAGFSIWSIHEMHYPGVFMEYALWEFKDDNWNVRPVYHAIANFTRFTERGHAVRRCQSSSPNHVAAACVGDTLFWVNKTDQELEVAVSGLPLERFTVYSQPILQGDRECGIEQSVNSGKMKLPPQSFGRAR